MKKFCFFLIIVLAVGVCAGNVHAVSEGEYQKASLYAFILGRASGCGVDTSEKGYGLIDWVKRTFPAGEHDGIISGILLISAEQQKLQKSGQTGESCSKIREIFNKMPIM